MKAAIYARYSSDAQNPRSLDDQVNECRAVATKRGWLVADDHVFLDAALSGSDTHRPAYLQLKQAALQRRFDYIVVDDLSRLGRDMVESATIFRELSEFGVALISVADGIDTSNPSAKIPFYFKGIMNEMFLDDMRAKIIRGLKGQVLRGYSAGGRVYGYKTNQILDSSGAKDKFGRPKRLGCEVLIDQEQAKIVRRIFEMKASGHGYRSIADHLNRLGVASPHAGCGRRSGFWSCATLRAMIHQRKYLGDWTWSKTRWLKRNHGGKRVRKTKPASEWVQYKCETLRIIPDEVWNAVQSRGARVHRPSSGPKGHYLLSGVLKCDRCNASLVAQNSGRSSVYMCGGYRNGGISVCSNNRRISRFILEKKFCDELNQVLTNRDVLDELTYQTRVALEERLAGDKTLSESLTQRKRELERRLANLVGLVEAGDVSQSISQRIAELERNLTVVDAELARTSRPVTRHPIVTIDLVASVLSDLCQLLSKWTDKSAQAKQAVRNLFPDKLSVTQEETDGEVIFNLNGNLHPFNGLYTPASLMLNSGAGT